MSEWAYRECKCGNRVHINFICDKCDGDPWCVRDSIKFEIKILTAEKAKLLKKLCDIESNIKFYQDRLKKTHMLKKRKPLETLIKKKKETPVSNKEITVSGMDANILNEKIFPSESDFYFKD
ncbi:MAG: hypothetical protein WC428_02330 [Candidatus Paceibacterota bacterium]